MFGRANMLILLAAILAGSMGYFLSRHIAAGWEPGEVASAPAPWPSTLPQVQLPDLDGNMHALADLQGQVILLNFWASWCPPCIKEMPHLIALQEAYADDGFTVVGIAQDQPEAVEQFLQRLPVNYPIWLDTGMDRVSAAFGNSQQALPFSVLIDRQGRIVERQLGLWPGPQMDRAVRQVLAGDHPGYVSG